MGYNTLIKDAIGGNSFSSGGSIAAQYDNDLSKIYSVNPVNWYRAKPYGFVFHGRDQLADSITFWLPISPENIQVTTHFATNLVTTLYGIVEEHSEVRYYDITISGTTGYAPKYYTHTKDAADSGISEGRKSFQGGFLEKISLPGGVGAGALNAAAQLVGSVTDAVTAVQGGAATTTGVDLNKSGYVAFHNFYRFLLQYKRDTSGQSYAKFTERPAERHPLQFLNYKDSIKYDCVPINFTLVRSAEDPMLYNYNIKMRAFNLRQVYDTAGEKGTTASFLAKLGLGANTVDQFDTALGSVGGAVRAVGSLF